MVVRYGLSRIKAATGRYQIEPLHRIEGMAFISSSGSQRDIPNHSLVFQTDTKWEESTEMPKNNRRKSADKTERIRDMGDMRDRDWGGFRVGRTKDHTRSGTFGRFRQLRSTKLPNPSEKRTVVILICARFSVEGREGASIQRPSSHVVQCVA